MGGTGAPKPRFPPDPSWPCHAPTLHPNAAPQCSALLGGQPSTPAPQGLSQGHPTLRQDAETVPSLGTATYTPRPSQAWAAQLHPGGGHTGLGRARQCCGTVPNVQELVAVPCQRCHTLPPGIFQHLGPPGCNTLPGGGGGTELGAGGIPWPPHGGLGAGGRGDDDRDNSAVPRVEHGPAPGEHGTTAPPRGEHGPTLSTAPR